MRIPFMPRPIGRAITQYSALPAVVQGSLPCLSKKFPAELPANTSPQWPNLFGSFYWKFRRAGKNLRFKEFIKRFWMFKNQNPILPALIYRNWNATAHLADLRGGACPPPDASLQLICCWTAYQLKAAECWHWLKTNVPDAYKKLS